MALDLNVKKKKTIMCACIFEPSILFHGSICLSLFQHNIVFIAAFRWLCLAILHQVMQAFRICSLFRNVWLPRVLCPYSNFRTTLLIFMTTNSKKEHILILSVSCYMSSYIEHMLYDIFYHAMNLGTATPYELILWVSKDQIWLKFNIYAG